MKDRQKRILQFLLQSRGILRIDDLAKIFSIGKRTVSRDLDEIERWLALKGGELERKPHQGIQVLTFGKEPRELLQTINTPDLYLETLPAPTRHRLILLYLIFNNRTVRIAEIAHAFFVSDTCAWNDLNQIEKQLLTPAFTLERVKREGVRLEGEETELRLTFLKTLTELFSSRTIIPYLYDPKGDNTASLDLNQFRLLLERIRFPAYSPGILQLISQTCEGLGYRFTMSGETLLYFYLQLTTHRIKSGALILGNAGSPCLDKFHQVAQSLLGRLTERIFSGKLPREETDFLGLFLQVLEIGDISASRAREYRGVVTGRISDFTQKMINEFGRIDGELYYLDDYMESVLNLAVTSLVTRLENRIPRWHGEWGSASLKKWKGLEKAQILIQLLDVCFGLKAEPRDLEYLLIHFHALVTGNRAMPLRKVRCLVCCFEGIGLANYLQSILRREIPELEIVEATAVYKIQQDYLDFQRIDLVLSTFPISNLQTPVVPISLPFDKSKLRKDLALMVHEMRESQMPPPGPKQHVQPAEQAEISFEELLDFINRFAMISLPATDSADEVIRALCAKLTGEPAARERLAADFLKRESLGPLFFEEYGTRILHCKSGATNRPFAGVVRFDDECQPRMIYLVAPAPCPESVRQMLSAVTVSFMEHKAFRKALMSGTLSQIRRQLMDIYKEMV
jgi:mannitol/fructose-specific phosphotransferase system IIA component (Ntr-type)/predicted DNA-binding transcriptional regulator